MKTILKMFIVAILIVAVTVATTACKGEEDSESTELKPLERGSVLLYIDPETGVNYLVFHDGYKGGITVRVNSSGAPIVSEVK